LLDLTRESDDTSLGAELLDEIAPGGSGSRRGTKAGTGAVGGSIAEASVVAGSVAGGSAVGVPAVQRGRLGAPAFIESSDPLAPFLGGAALGAVAGAVIPGVSVLEGAVIGAAVGGLAGAVWADRDNDGRVDGYVYNGQYYTGAPSAAPAPMAPPPTRSGERG